MDIPARVLECFMNVRSELISQRFANLPPTLCLLSVTEIRQSERATRAHGLYAFLSPRMEVTTFSKGRWFAIQRPAALVEILQLKEAPTQELCGIIILSISFRRFSIAHRESRYLRCESKARSRDPHQAQIRASVFTLTTFCECARRITSSSHEVLSKPM